MVVSLLSAFGRYFQKLTGRYGLSGSGRRGFCAVKIELVYRVSYHKLFDAHDRAIAYKNV